MEDLDIIEERNGYRVRLEIDDLPEPPYDDGAPPIFTLIKSFFSGDSLEAFNSQAEEYLPVVRRLLEDHGLGVLERFVKIFYDAVRFDSFYSDGISGTYFAFDTAAWREKVGVTKEILSGDPANDYLSEVKAWANGEVYGYIVERKVDLVTTWLDSMSGERLTTVESQDWIQTEDGSCWGFYGRKYAEQAAKEALAEELESAPSDNWKRADHAATALQSYYDEAYEFGETYGDEGSAEFYSTLHDLLKDLRHLAFRAGVEFSDINDQASESYCEELDAEGDK